MNNRRAPVVLFALAFLLAAGETISQAGDLDSNQYSAKPLVEDALAARSKAFTGTPADFLSRSLDRFAQAMDRALIDIYGTNQALNSTNHLPVALNDDWKLVGRPILSVVPNENTIHQLKGLEEDYRIGEISLMALLSPVRTSDSFIWGVGSAVTLPAAAEDEYEAAAWQIGPAVAAFYLGNHWILGLLSRHQWSFRGDSSRPDASQTTLQYFFEYDLLDRLQIGMAHYVMFNWNTERGYASPFPFDLDEARTFGVGKLPVKFSLDGFVEISANWKF